MWPSAAASHASTRRNCGSNTATWRPTLPRSSLTVFAPASTLPSTHWDCASNIPAGKLQDAADSAANAATVSYMRGAAAPKRPRATSTVPTRTLAMPHARYWPGDEIWPMSPDRASASSKSPIRVNARISPYAVR